MNKATKVFLKALIFLGVASCSTTPDKKPPTLAPPQITAEFNRAKDLISKKKTTKGLLLLKNLSKAHAQTELADDALMLLGETYYRSRDYERAYKSFITVVRSNIYSPVEAQALYMSAKSLTMLSRYDEALSLISTLIEKHKIEPKEELSVYKLKFLLLSKLGDKLDSVRTLVILAKMEPSLSKRKSYKLKAIDFVELELNFDDLQKASSDDSFGFARGHAFYKLGLHFFEKQNYSDALSAFERAAEILPNSDISEQAQGYINQVLARQVVEPKTIGVVLPLTSQHSKVAYRTLRGLQLGLGVYGQNKSQFKLAIIDSEANPDSARRAVERLVLEDHAIAVVGSLLSKTAAAVAAKSEELGVPNITLSQKSGLTDIGRNVFRNALTSQMQVQMLVKTAMELRGFKRFAILYPNDNYGIEYANLFWDEVLARGGQITAVQTYRPKETDFSGPIKRLTGTFYYEDRLTEYRSLLKEWYKKQKYISSRTSPPGDLLPPAIDFDALFIPDSARTLGQIAPMMAYQEVNNVTLLGTNIWNSYNTVKRGQQYVENSIFVDGLLLSDRRFSQSDFYKEFYSTFQLKPSIFESQAYDIGLLLRQLIIDGHRTRDELAGALRSVKNFNGSYGSLDMSDKRELSRPLYSLTIHNGKIIPLTSELIESIKALEEAEDRPDPIKSKK